MTHREIIESSAILDRVRADLIVRALTKEESKESRFWKHPFVRLFAPFLLTTVVGTWLAYVWQTREWTEQQDYTARQQIAKTRMDVMTAFVRRVSELVAAGDDLMALYQFELTGALAPMREHEMEERIKRWFDENRRWRIDEKVLVAQVRANFSDPRISQRLTEILIHRRDLSQTVNKFLGETGGRPLPDPPPKSVVKLHNHAITVIVETTGGTKQVEEGLLAKLSTVMIEETRRDQHPR